MTSAVLVFIDHIMTDCTAYLPSNSVLFCSPTDSST